MGIKKKLLKRGIGFIAFLTMAPNSIIAQEFNLINKESSLTVLGTSSLHDWHIIAEEQSGKIIFQNLSTGLIAHCNIEIVVESLKSGKSSMDRNTYKALNTNNHKNISVQLVKITETINKGDGKYVVNAMCNMTISGFKKRVPLEFALGIVDGQITLTGETELKMTDFEIEPPKALLGTITTGDEVTIKFSTKFK